MNFFVFPLLIISQINITIDHNIVHSFLIRNPTADTLVFWIDSLNNKQDYNSFQYYYYKKRGDFSFNDIKHISIEYGINDELKKCLSNEHFVVKLIAPKDSFIVLSTKKFICDSFHFEKYNLISTFFDSFDVKLFNYRHNLIFYKNE